MNDALESVGEYDTLASPNRNHHLSPFFNALSWPAANSYCLAAGGFPFALYHHILTIDDFLMPHTFDD